MKTTEHRTKGAHVHARKGFDFGTQARGIYVIEIRKDREFDPKEIAYHAMQIEHWVERHVLRTMPNTTVDMASFRIYHDEGNNQLVASFVIHNGWRDEYMCFAHTMFEAEHRHTDTYSAAMALADMLSVDDEPVAEGPVH